MKHLSLALALATASTMVVADCTTKKACQSCKCEATSKTFFSVRPMYSSVKPELIAGFRNERAHVRKTNEKQHGKGGAFDFVAFGSKSTNDKRLASYFMPDCSTCMDVTDGLADESLKLDSQHFNIVPTTYTDEDFDSTISFKMHQSVLGLGMHYKQLFHWNPEETKGWWFSVSSPIMHVKNTVKMSEKNEHEFTSLHANAVGSMTAAFNQTAWNYGKIACDCPKGKTGFGDIEAKLGYEFLPCPEAHFACYGGLVIPTGNKPKAHYVFESIVGNGGHVGIETGMEGGYIAWQNVDKNHWFSVEFATNTNYLFKNKQMRSFDVKYKPWSRYQQVYANYAQALEANTNQDTYLFTPGINVFTQKVKVTPRLSHNITTAAVYNASAFRIEVGYNLFCRQAECVKLACPWPTQENAPAFKASMTDTFVDNLVNPLRTIYANSVENAGTGYGIADYTKGEIREDQLDMHSASHPAIVSNTFHLAMGYRWDEAKFPAHIDCGGSYEFADYNTVLDRWTVWAKAGFTF